MQGKLLDYILLKQSSGRALGATYRSNTSSMIKKVQCSLMVTLVGFAGTIPPLLVRALRKSRILCD